MIIQTLVVGPIQANCFILGCEATHEAAIIDPGDEVPRILQVLNREGLKASCIINTHCHFDHVGGNRALKEATGADLLIHAADAPGLSCLSASAAAWGMAAENSPPPDRTIADGDTICFGRINLQVIHTPGHSPGGISLLTDKMVFVGDTLFAGSIGRTDFPGGDYETLISGVRTRLFSLGDEVQVFPGHGPATSIGEEKRYNPFFR
ncbi:MAG: MBL fold metallo-hydrolase [Deltaproteobacteria bacterium]|nr:MBL fold metallo-hydrolase [Deltaproteobacteria bacterium]